MASAVRIAATSGNVWQRSGCLLLRRWRRRERRCSGWGLLGGRRSRLPGLRIREGSGCSALRRLGRSSGSGDRLTRLAFDDWRGRRRNRLQHDPHRVRYQSGRRIFPERMLCRLAGADLNCLRDEANPGDGHHLAFRGHRDSTGRHTALALRCAHTGARWVGFESQVLKLRRRRLRRHPIGYPVGHRRTTCERNAHDSRGGGESYA
jgi:hypothetical protein